MKLELSDDADKKFVIDKEPVKMARTQPFLVDPVGEKPKNFTHSVVKSDLLARLDEFLPKIRKSNQELLGVDPVELDIERVTEGSEYIQMDLGLGVFDTKPPGVEDSSDDSVSILMPGSVKLNDTRPVIDSFFSQDDSESDSSTGESDDELEGKKLIEEI